MEARPLSAHVRLEEHETQAESLQRSRGAGEALHEWIERWVSTYADEEAETQARLRGLTLTPELRDLAKQGEIARVSKKIINGSLVMLADARPVITLADAQLLIARLYGFENWTNFSKQVAALQSPDSLESRFEAAADAIISGDIQTLAQLLRDDPQLISVRSLRSHNSTLLHYVAANGVEGFRQKTPKNIVDIAKLLLDAGADVNATSYAYGGPATVLGLAATSVHPERAGVQEPLLQILIDRGAGINDSDIAGNKHALLEGCLRNGRGNAATYLASRGANLNLETAAGAGRLDVVKSLVNSSPDAVLNSSSDRVLLQRGFLWACEFGHDDIVAFLIDHGADLRDQANTNEAALHWAVVGCQLSTVKLLLEHGAPLEELNAYGGTALGQALWSWANSGGQPCYIPIFEALLAAGAQIEDDTLAWLDEMIALPAADRARVAEIFRSYGASS